MSFINFLNDPSPSNSINLNYPTPDSIPTPVPPAKSKAARKRKVQGPNAPKKTRVDVLAHGRSCVQCAKRHAKCKPQKDGPCLVCIEHSKKKGIRFEDIICTYNHFEAPKWLGGVKKKKPKVETEEDYEDESEAEEDEVDLEEEEKLRAKIGELTSLLTYLRSSAPPDMRTPIANSYSELRTPVASHSSPYLEPSYRPLQSLTPPHNPFDLPEVERTRSWSGSSFETLRFPQYQMSYEKGAYRNAMFNETKEWTFDSTGNWDANKDRRYRSGSERSWNGDEISFDPGILLNPASCGVFVPPDLPPLEILVRIMRAFFQDPLLPGFITSENLILQRLQSGRLPQPALLHAICLLGIPNLSTSSLMLPSEPMPYWVYLSSTNISPLQFHSVKTHFHIYYSIFSSPEQNKLFINDPHAFVELCQAKALLNFHHVNRDFKPFRAWIGLRLATRYCVMAGLNKDFRSLDSHLPLPINEDEARERLCTFWVILFGELALSAFVSEPVSIFPEDITCPIPSIDSLNPKPWHYHTSNEFWVRHDDDPIYGSFQLACKAAILFCRVMIFLLGIERLTKHRRQEVFYQLEMLHQTLFATFPRHFTPANVIGQPSIETSSSLVVRLIAHTLLHSSWIGLHERFVNPYEPDSLHLQRCEKSCEEILKVFHLAANTIDIGKVSTSPINTMNVSWTIAFRALMRLVAVKRLSGDFEGGEKYMKEAWEIYRQLESRKTTLPLNASLLRTLNDYLRNPMKSLSNVWLTLEGGGDSQPHVEVTEPGVSQIAEQILQLNLDA